MVDDPVADLIAPPVTLSSPATILSSVDLPQPDGPTSTTNCPSAMSTLTPCRTGTAPNAFDTLRIATCAIVPPFACCRLFWREKLING